MEANQIIVITPEIALKHIEGDLYIEEVQKFIDGITKYLCMEYFYYNNLQLINGDVKVYLTNNIRHEEFIDNLKIILVPDYNPLLNRLPGDAKDYFKNYNYSPYYYDIGDEALDFLTYHIMEDFLEAEIITDLTDQQILNTIGLMDATHQKVIKTADYKELITDIKTAWKELIKDILTDAETALQEEYYEAIYYPAQEQAERDLFDLLPEYKHRL